MTSGNIDDDDDDDDGDGDGNHPRDGTSGDRPHVPRSPKASSGDPNARPGRNASNMQCHQKEVALESNSW
jgi:hypothetical protein